ncbi:DUF4149 domain-containing protein [Campylobacter sp. MIT 12-8780]|uniref:DUF4149 domain-containing protein n=1 Tax=unclassified Campylobacter TaxID=2593542 RepID=UPI0010F4E9E6|nr:MULTISPECIES: DUF4149 domain-containing protein [unclassified Campylobacter]TKX29088.1 DUF4149 domain-containing protein [Campylobacter sp. MIT 12-5580]TQR41902.1 DUF4149 domain-containing protein [Campylobacter sp. MIT 12-8780]
MKAINLLLLGSIIGIGLFLGIAVAVSVFYPPTGLGGEAITDAFGSGLIMGQIFLKFGYVLISIALINTIYELFFAEASLKIIKILLAVVILALSLLFVFYYTLPMLETQSLIIEGKAGLEALAGEEFSTKHTQSEWLVKIILILQVALFFLSYKSAKVGYNR